jgi:hypothetical protein
MAYSIPIHHNRFQHSKALTLSQQAKANAAFAEAKAAHHGEG